MSDTPEKPARPRRSYQRSGVHTLKNAVATLGKRALPSARTALGRELQAWRAALVADLGGAGVVSTQQLALVDVAVRTKLMLDSVDAYVLGLDSLVNKRKRTLFPVVRERQSLAAALQGVLRDLGLERRAPAKSVAELLAELREQGGGETPRAGADSPAGGADDAPSGPDA